VKVPPRADLTLRVGIDAVGVDRVRTVISDDDERRRAVFTERELEHCRGRRREYEHLAARFAAKEAVLKAFGTGVSRRMRFIDVEVINEPSGRPRVELAGAVAEFAREHGLRQLDVSLTHTEGLAMATAITAWEGRCAFT
jgi:holo-[acyl-carrier protein] synthase